MTTETNLVLTADQQAVAQRKIRDLHGATGTIFSLLKEGKLVDADLATNCVKVAEFNLMDLCKALGVETDSAQDREQRYADLRATNMRIRELEAQLGRTVTAEATQHSLKNMADHLNKWWDVEGFGHISDISFGQYVCKVDFSCHLFGTMRLIDSETPVSDKGREADWHDSLRARGFVLIEEDRDVNLADCDANRNALIDLFKSRMPSSSVYKFDNVNLRRVKAFALRGVEIYIHKIAEILALPVPSTTEAS